MKPKVKKIILDKETVQKMNEIISSDYSNKSKQIRLKQIGIRTCLTCGEIATKQLIYQVGDKEQKASRVERYCDNCIERWKKDIIPELKRKNCQSNRK